MTLQTLVTTISLALLESSVYWPSQAKSELSCTQYIYIYMYIYTHTHTHTHTYQPKVLYLDRALNRRYRNQLKYLCCWVNLWSACTLYTNHSNFTVISKTTPFLNFGDIHTLVYENQKNQPLWLVLHRRCRDRPVIQHVPHRKSKLLPYFVKLTTGFFARA